MAFRTRLLCSVLAFTVAYGFIFGLMKLEITFWTIVLACVLGQVLLVLAKHFIRKKRN